MPARKNDLLLRVLVAAALALVTWGVLQKMPFYPDWLELALAAAIGAFAFVSPGNASLVLVLAAAVPLVASEFVTGMLFLIGGLAVTQFLSVGRAGAFTLAALAIVAVPLHAEWAAVAVAGLLVGRNRGAAAGATAAIALIAIGVATGSPVVGTMVTGAGTPGLLALAEPPADPLTFTWLVPALKNADPLALFNAVRDVQQPLLLALEVVLWAAAGALGALFARPRQRAFALVGPALAVMVLAAGHVAVELMSGEAVGMRVLLATLAVSLPVAVLAAAVSLWVFPVVKVGPRVAESHRERDVDELLQVIASAEDELAARHNTEAVVLITDMKSFSAMTEEIGSVESAKIVQRHRDLLLPVIKAHNGKGAPTGGDGLVASFNSPTDAVHAAVAIQRALEGYTGSDRSPHELSIRVGVASGEVVIDAHGVPFLGTALNLAARVMDLADGGRVMITSYVAATSGLPPAQLFRHGEFKLKNIAEVIPVVEVLWREGQTPQEIRVV